MAPKNNKLSRISKKAKLAPPAPPKRKGGRPSKRNPILEEMILTHIRSGNFKETSCQSCGIDVATLASWINKDPEWAARVAMAEAEAELALVAKIKAAQADGTWRAHAWLLERTRPNKFAADAELKAEQREYVRQQREALRKATDSGEVTVVVNVSPPGSPAGAATVVPGLPDPKGSK